VVNKLGVNDSSVSRIWHRHKKVQLRGYRGKCDSVSQRSGESLTPSPYMVMKIKPEELHVPTAGFYLPLFGHFQDHDREISVEPVESHETCQNQTKDSHQAQRFIHSLATQHSIPHNSSTVILSPRKRVGPKTGSDSFVSSSHPDHQTLPVTRRSTFLCTPGWSALLTVRHRTLERITYLQMVLGPTS
jgi:hypothetical protein